MNNLTEASVTPPLAPVGVNQWGRLRLVLRDVVAVYGQCQG